MSTEYFIYRYRLAHTQGQWCYSYPTYSYMYI